MHSGSGSDESTTTSDAKFDPTSSADVLCNTNTELAQASSFPCNSTAVFGNLNQASSGTITPSGASATTSATVEIVQTPLDSTNMETATTVSPATSGFDSSISTSGLCSTSTQPTQNENSPPVSSTTFGNVQLPYAAAPVQDASVPSGTLSIGSTFQTGGLFASNTHPTQNRNPPPVNCTTFGNVQLPYSAAPVQDASVPTNTFSLSPTSTTAVLCGTEVLPTQSLSVPPDTNTSITFGNAQLPCSAATTQDVSVPTVASGFGTTCDAGKIEPPQSLSVTGNTGLFTSGLVPPPPPLTSATTQGTTVPFGTAGGSAVFGEKPTVSAVFGTSAGSMAAPSFGTIASDSTIPSFSTLASSVADSGFGALASCVGASNFGTSASSTAASSSVKTLFGQPITDFGHSTSSTSVPSSVAPASRTATPSSGTLVFNTPLGQPSTAIGHPVSTIGFSFGIGHPASTNVFSSALGAPVPCTLSSFGTATPSSGTNLFRQQNNPFQQPFSTKAGFGATHNGTAVKFDPPTENNVMMESDTSKNICVRHQCITCMKCYENKSLEELRMEDYVGNRKSFPTGKKDFGVKPEVPNVFRSAAFGASDTSATGFYRKINPSYETSLFGQSSVSSGASLFGQSSVGSGASLFGQPSVGSGPSLFGQPSVGSGPSLFGQPSVGSGASLFGQPSVGSGANLFGQPSVCSGANLYGQSSVGHGLSFSTSGGSCDGFVAPNSGTTVKFNPPHTGIDTMMVLGVSTNIKTRQQCITSMKEYANKCLEELRVEDYAANRKGPTTFVSGFGNAAQTKSFGNNSQFATPTPAFTGFGTAAQTKSFGSNSQLAPPTSTFTSFGNHPPSKPYFGSPDFTGFNVTCNGTTIRFISPTGTDTMMKGGLPINVKTRLQNITGMQEYENMSPEELRMQDYAANRKGSQMMSSCAFGTARSSGLFGQPENSYAALWFDNAVPSNPVFGDTITINCSSTCNGTWLKFTPCTGIDTTVTKSTAVNVNTRHQCITSMKEYQNKCLEELRWEDYIANRKGPQPGTRGFIFTEQSASPSAYPKFGTKGPCHSCTCDSKPRFGTTGEGPFCFGSNSFGPNCQPQNTSMFSETSECGIDASPANRTVTFGNTASTSAFGRNSHQKTGLLKNEPPAYGATNDNSTTHRFRSGAASSISVAQSDSRQMPNISTFNTGSTDFFWSAISWVWFL